MNNLRYVFFSVLAICITFLIYRACQAMAASNEEIDRERKRIVSQVNRHSRLDSGDCVPVRLFETDDENRFIVIGDYRKDSFVVLQRFVDGYRVIHPVGGSVSPTVKQAIIRLDTAP